MADHIIDLVLVQGLRNNAIDQALFVCLFRIQNSARIALPAPGDHVALQIEEGAARLLAD
jgi:hypothetical protein